MHKTIAKITSTFLGASEDTHGFFTAQIGITYDANGQSGQTAGGYDLGVDNGFAQAFIGGVLSAAGVDSWEKLVGCNVLVLTEHDVETEGVPNPILGFAPLPTERGLPTVFAEIADHYKRVPDAR